MARYASVFSIAVLKHKSRHPAAPTRLDGESGGHQNGQHFGLYVSDLCVLSLGTAAQGCHQAGVYGGGPLPIVGLTEPQRTGQGDPEVGPIRVHVFGDSGCVVQIR
jgi:hypothetical protein